MDAVVTGFLQRPCQRKAGTFRTSLPDGEMMIENLRIIIPSGRPVGAVPADLWSVCLLGLNFRGEYLTVYLERFTNFLDTCSELITLIENDENTFLEFFSGHWISQRCVDFNISKKRMRWEYQASRTTKRPNVDPILNKIPSDFCCVTRESHHHVFFEW